MKKITFIGTGDAFHSGGRAHSCYLIETVSGQFLLVDAGATALYRMQKMELSTDLLDGILFTHFHGDHISGLPFLLMEMDIVKRRKKELLLMGPRGIDEEWGKWLDLFYPGHVLKFPIRTAVIDSDESVFFGLGISSRPVNHKKESQGYRIKDRKGRIFVFSGDTAMDDALISLVNDSYCAVIEMSMEKQVNPPVLHIAMNELIEKRHLLNTKHLIISHTSPDLAEMIHAKRICNTAEDGMVLDLDGPLFS